MSFGNTRFQVDPASGLSLPWGMKFGEQKDGSIIRPSGELITPDDRLEIMAQYEGLPVSTEKEALKNFLANNTICIVRADTGSGKSTQIPKILAEEFPEMQIVVTQPRVVAAMQLADRVGKEMISNSGNASDDISGFYNPVGKIGYRTGSGNSFKKISNISYHTDGLELKRQIHGHCPGILVIDEAHGYSVSVEMLMKLYRDLHMKNKNIRLVIMSATIDATNIKKFFDYDIPEKTISGRQHPIVHEHKPGKDPVDIVLSLVGGKGGKGIPHTKTGYVGEDILVFVPGKKEINDVITRISSQTTQIEALPLHAQVSPEEKAYALRKNPDGKQRVIVATNVAQESLTPDGIKTVISTGEVKVMYNNQGIQELHTEDISFFDYMQQAGRGGRQSDGKAESTNMKSPEEFIKEAVPPISRQALHSEILDLEVIRKKSKLPQNGKTLTSSQKNEVDQTWSLAQAVNNPEKSPFVHRVDKVNLSFAYKELQEMGALDKNREITQLGEALVKLPLSVHTGRMLLESLSRDCLLQMLPIIAILEKKSFLHKDGKWQEMKMEGKEHGDLFALSSLLTFFLRSDHTDGELSRLVSLGVSDEEIELYKKNEIRTPLGLSVDLSPIGVKTQQLQAIAYLIEDLKRRLPSIDSRAHDLLFQPEDTSKMSESERKKQKFKQIYAQKVCITTGFLSHIFHSKKQQQKKKGPPKKEGETQKIRLIHQATLDEFIQGNSSVFEMDFHKKSSQEVFFVGQPFRIVPKGEDAISLALYLTPIDHDILEEATHHSSYDSAFALSTYDVSDEKSVVSYNLHKETYIEKLPKLKTRTQKKEYFAKHCLPSLLIEENPDIHEYIEGLTPIRQAIFKKDVLPRIIENHAHSIQPENIEQTEQIFIRHPHIKKEIQESSDFFIKAFVSGQIDTFEKAVMIIDEGKKYAPYEEQRDEYQKKSAKSKTIASKRQLYQEEYLPILLIQQNYHIKKYMETLSLEQKIIFRKYILPKLLSNHSSRIYPYSLPRTEKSFISDTIILDDLRNSKDPTLIDFASGKIDTIDKALEIFDAGKKPDFITGSTEIDDGMSADLSRELYNAKLGYIRLASDARRLFLDNGNEKFLDISDVKKKTVEKVYHTLLLPKAHLGLDQIQGQLSSLSEAERQKITVGIKEFQRAYEHDLQKQQVAREKLLSLGLIKGIFQANTPGMIPSLTEYLGNLSDFITPVDCADIISTYHLLRMEGQNGKKKGKIAFQEKVAPLFKSVEQKIIQNNKTSAHSIYLDPIIDRLDTVLYTIFAEHFDPLYFTHGVQPKLSELRNNIIRHSYTGEAFYSELKKSFQKFSYAHMTNNQELVELIQEYESLLIKLEPYVDHYLSDGTSEKDRSMNIRTTSDLEMITDHMRSLEWLYQELREKRTKIKDLLG